MASANDPLLLDVRGLPEGAARLCCYRFFHHLANGTPTDQLLSGFAQAPHRDEAMSEAGSSEARRRDERGGRRLFSFGGTANFGGATAAVVARRRPPLLFTTNNQQPNLEFTCAMTCDLRRAQMGAALSCSIQRDG